MESKKTIVAGLIGEGVSSLLDHLTRWKVAQAGPTYWDRMNPDRVQKDGIAQYNLLPDKEQTGKGRSRLESVLRDRSEVAGRKTSRLKIEQLFFFIDTISNTRYILRKGYGYCGSRNLRYKKREEAGR
jgi:hypothetical protein